MTAPGSIPGAARSAATTVPGSSKQNSSSASAGRIDLGPSAVGHIPLTEAADAATRPEKKIGGPIRFSLPLRPTHPDPGRDSIERVPK